MEMLEELEKDFNTLANKIDFKNYDPLDPNFMKASVVGLMWLVGGKLCRGNDIEEELEGAENYFHMYEESGDPDYKEMSLDELKHAGILLKKHMANSYGTEREALSELESKRKHMVSTVTTAAVPMKNMLPS